jgi:cytochrome P450
MLGRWHAMAEPFDLATEMAGLTLDIIAGTMFSADIRAEVETVRRLMDIAVNQRPGMALQAGSGT